VVLHLCGFEPMQRRIRARSSSGGADDADMFKHGCACLERRGWMIYPSIISRCISSLYSAQFGVEYPLMPSTLFLVRQCTAWRPAGCKSCNNIHCIMSGLRIPGNMIPAPPPPATLPSFNFWTVYCLTRNSLLCNTAGTI
jgi:hypothetical protein